jgi:hypothetical protein
MTTPNYQLGILLVHGIGTQPAGDTLTRWGDVLVKTIAHATNGAVTATVERAGKDLNGAETDRTEARLRLESAGNVEHWLVSEGWWAESFLAPSYRELVSWSFRAIPWALTTHIAQRYWLAKSGRTPKGVAITLALLKLIVGLLLAPFLILALAVVLLVGLIPIPGVRVALLRAESLFTATVGDSLVFVESPVRAALIKTRILEGLEGLQQRCDRTIVVAHSQGAAASVECLGGIAGMDQPPVQQPDTLVTFGAGTNPLSMLRRSEGLPKSVAFDPVRWAMAASLGVAALSAWLAFQVTRGGLAPRKILLAFLLWLALGVVVVATGVVGTKLAKLLEPRTPRLASRARRAAIPASVILWILGMVALYQAADPLQIPFASVLFLILSLLVLGVSIYTILSRSWERMLTTVRYPPGLSRWIDLYASADPVPVGPTLTQDHKRIEFHEIWNEGSVITDHVLYWRNLDEFVLRVVRACAQTARSAWVSKLPPESAAVDRRARWRVSWLQIARTALITIGVALGIVLLQRKSFAVANEIAAFIPKWIANLVRPDVLDRATLIALIAAGVWLAHTLTRVVWLWWVGKEQVAILEQQSPDGLEQRPLIGMGMISWVALLSAISIVAGTSLIEKAATGSVAAIVGAGLLFAAVSLGLAVGSVYVLRKLNPAPEPEAPLKTS